MQSQSLICLALFVSCGSSFAEQSIKISRPVWAALTAEERDKVHNKFIVQIISPEDFGVIIDNQGIEESTPGTTGGAALGSALAQTTYIDRAIKGGNYSATSQLGLAILGAVIGSSLDSKGVRQYHFRYAVRLGSGEVKYADHLQGDAFRHPNGICVAYPNIAPTDEGLCTLTAASFRTKYLEETPTPAKVAQSSSGTIQSSNEVSAKPIAASTDLVQCKVGTQPAVLTTAYKCNLIEGIQIQGIN